MQPHAPPRHSSHSSGARNGSRHARYADRQQGVPAYSEGELSSQRSVDDWERMQTAPVPAEAHGVHSHSSSRSERSNRLPFGYHTHRTLSFDQNTLPPIDHMHTMRYDVHGEQPWPVQHSAASAMRAPLPYAHAAVAPSSWVDHDVHPHAHADARWNGMTHPDQHRTDVDWHGPAMHTGGAYDRRSYADIHSRPHIPPHSHSHSRSSSSSSPSASPSPAVSHWSDRSRLSVVVSDSVDGDGGSEEHGTLEVFSPHSPRHFQSVKNLWQQHTTSPRQQQHSSDQQRHHEQPPVPDAPVKEVASQRAVAHLSSDVTPAPAAASPTAPASFSLARRTARRNISFADTVASANMGYIDVQALKEESAALVSADAHAASISPFVSDEEVRGFNEWKERQRNGGAQSIVQSPQAPPHHDASSRPPSAPHSVRAVAGSAATPVLDSAFQPPSGNHHSSSSSVSASSSAWQGQSQPADSSSAPSPSPPAHRPTIRPVVGPVATGPPSHSGSGGALSPGILRPSRVQTEREHRRSMLMQQFTGLEQLAEEEQNAGSGSQRESDTTGDQKEQAERRTEREVDTRAPPAPQSFGAQLHPHATVPSAVPPSTSTAPSLSPSLALNLTDLPDSSPSSRSFGSDDLPSPSLSWPSSPIRAGETPQQRHSRQASQGVTRRASGSGTAMESMQRDRAEAGTKQVQGAGTEQAEQAEQAWAASTSPVSGLDMAAIPVAASDPRPPSSRQTPPGTYSLATALAVLARRRSNPTGHTPSDSTPSPSSSLPLHQVAPVLTTAPSPVPASAPAPGRVSPLPRSVHTHASATAHESHMPSHPGTAATAGSSPPAAAPSPPMSPQQQAAYDAYTAFYYAQYAQWIHAQQEAQLQAQRAQQVLQEKRAQQEQLAWYEEQAARQSAMDAAAWHQNPHYSAAYAHFMRAFYARLQQMPPAASMHHSFPVDPCIHSAEQTTSEWRKHSATREGRQRVRDVSTHVHSHPQRSSRSRTRYRLPDANLSELLASDPSAAGVHALDQPSSRRAHAREPEHADMPLHRHGNGDTVPFATASALRPHVHPRPRPPSASPRISHHGRAAASVSRHRHRAHDDAMPSSQQLPVDRSDVQPPHRPRPSSASASASGSLTSAERFERLLRLHEALTAARAAAPQGATYRRSDSASRHAHATPSTDVRPSRSARAAADADARRLHRQSSFASRASLHTSEEEEWSSEEGAEESDTASTMDGQKDAVRGGMAPPTTHVHLQAGGGEHAHVRAHSPAQLEAHPAIPPLALAPVLAAASATSDSRRSSAAAPLKRLDIRVHAP